MKRSFMMFCIGLIGFGFSSCDEDNLASVLPDFDVNLSESQEIPVTIDKTDGEWAEFSSTENISIINKDTEDHLNKIKSVTLTKLNYTVINFNGDEMGEVEGAFSADNGVAMQNKFVVKTAAQNGTVYEVDATELNRIGKALKAGNTVMVRYSGKALCDNASMNFVIKVSYEAKIKVSP